MSAASFASEKHRIGKLHGADLVQINKRLQQQYRRAGLPRVFAGIDMSLNEEMRFVAQSRNGFNHILIDRSPF